MTTTEEVIRLTREVADASLNDPVVGSSIVLDIGEMKRHPELGLDPCFSAYVEPSGEWEYRG